MPFKQKLADETGIPTDKLPSSYQIIGDVLLIKLPLLSAAEKKKVAESIKEFFPKIKTIGEIGGISGELRKPKVKKLLGNGFETIHKEHGLLYKLDASKIMFSKGNLFERQRIAKEVKNNEIVIDMFAGIGYFSLGLKKAKKVYAIEKNPIAYKYLKENIKLNKIANIEAINADCRKIDLPRADRIIMGYFPHTEKYLPYARNFCRSGTIIHFHNTYRKDELWSKPLAHIKKHFDCKIIEKKKVKSFAPNVYHVVVDFECDMRKRENFVETQHRIAKTGKYCHI